jgi:3-oxoacyl-[acyl-carrier-protein] synthase II
MRRVAVTGFGVVSPIGVGREAFWDALRAGRSGIGRIARFDCSRFAVQLAGEVKETPPLPDRVAAIAAEDPKVGFAFAACAEAMASAGLARLGPDALLHLGVSLEIFPVDRIAFGGAPDLPGVLDRVLDPAGRGDRPFQIPLDAANRLIEEAFGRPGESLVNCSACAAGAQAIGHAFRGVRSGRFDVALCGGFDSMINPLGVGGFQMLGALTTDNDRGASACRPFDASRSGTVLGEGAAAFVLEPLDAARAAGKPVLAEVCGYGSTLDACGLSAPDPEGDGAARAMRAALDDARLPPEAIGHLNAHGTGTQLNDEIEAAAIRRVFDGTWQKIPVSATKSVTGHLIAAAGAVEAGACLLPLLRGWLPPNPWLRKVAPGCELFHVTGEAARFDGEYALSNSFGFGGQNAALILRRAAE